MEEQELELLPSGLLTCLLDKREVRITKVSVKRITVRVAEEFEDIKELKLCVYVFDKYKYKELILKKYNIVSVEKDEFYYLYTIEINDEKYKEYIERVFRDYSRYVTLKNYGCENEFSEEMVNYPSEKDFDFYEFYDEQKLDWMDEINYEEYDENILNNTEIAVLINNDDLYKLFLKENIEHFQEIYLEKNYIENSKIFKKKISRVYIGNEFCHNLFPSLDNLIKMIQKAYDEKLDITLCFTYLRECYIDKNIKILDTVYNWCKENNTKIEIVINDYGMLKLIQNKCDYFSLSLGVLLNKRKKDPRYIYKKGYVENKERISLNSLNDSDYRKFLKKYNIKRYEYESCGYKISIAEGNHSLHMPFYITNTSQYCTLYAMCKNLDRGKQILVENCPKYCREYVFSYPKHLKMVGRYNSLFAFDETILKDWNRLKYYVNNGIDRIVLNFI